MTSHIPKTQWPHVACGSQIGQRRPRTWFDPKRRQRVEFLVVWFTNPLYLHLPPAFPFGKFLPSWLEFSYLSQWPLPAWFLDAILENCVSRPLSFALLTPPAFHHLRASIYPLPPPTPWPLGVDLTRSKCGSHPLSLPLKLTALVTTSVVKPVKQYFYQPTLTGCAMPGRSMADHLI